MASTSPHHEDCDRASVQSTRRKYAGLGIGLALVKRLMEAHEGSVSVASAGTGRGTDVALRLPLVSEFEDTAQPVASRRLPDLSGVRILVVEDTDDSLEAITLTLERLGAHVLAARDGVEGLEAVAARPIDLVLCDLRMPRMDGFEFLRKLDEMQGRQHVPVIAVSGLSGGADHQARRRPVSRGMSTSLSTTNICWLPWAPLSRAARGYSTRRGRMPRRDAERVGCARAG